MRTNMQKGFSLIEVMVATSIFVVVVVMSIGTLLTATKANKISARMREQMNTISFVMEDMVRNMRLGTNFHCAGVIGEPVDIEAPFSCPEYSAGTGLQKSLKVAFESFSGQSGNGNDQFIYWFLTDASTGKGYIAKSKTGDGPQTSTQFSRITGPLINIDLVKSGFTVYSADHTDGTPGDTTQTRILIRISGTVDYQGQTTPFTIQTTVTPRVFDA